MSEKLGRGRHTTRHVELFRLEEDTLVMDTPGFSAFDSEELDIALKKVLPETFGNFAPIWTNAASPAAAIPRKKAAPYWQLWRRERSPRPGMKVICAFMKSSNP